ncbi:MAG: CPBP family intramembrane metalloprotease [Methylocystaceae bacterium]|nr:CPBP family intramembrane metalloprotease [Methylocystaceae bacterium]
MSKLVLCISLFLIGWGKFYLSPPWIFMADYGLRILIVWLLWDQILVALNQWRMPRFRTWLEAIGVCAVLLTVDQWVSSLQTYDDFNQLLFIPVSFPLPDQVPLIVFDYTVGLILVALSEEFVFRRGFGEKAEASGWSMIKLYVLSSMIFAFIHIPQGLASFTTALIWGGVLMYFYLKTRTVLFTVLMHLAVDMWYFGIPYWESLTS